MKKLHNLIKQRTFIFLAITLSLLVVSCEKDEPDDNPEFPEVTKPTTINDSIESGNIASVTKISDTIWELTIGDDNNNADLPDSFRSWWYVKINNAVNSSVTKLTIRNSGWSNYYLPVYSYDGGTWFRFNENEVSSTGNVITIQKRFEEKAAHVAMFYPYTLTDLENYITKHQGNSNMTVTVPGYSRQGRPLYLIKLTGNGPVNSKKRVIMHARTHPAEIPASFVIEGMIDYLLSGTGEANALLNAFEFYIFPMQNVDGVVAGNYRTTPLSENLEMMWAFNPSSPMQLINPPPEVAVIHNTVLQLMQDGGPEISMALNMHASNGDKDLRTFFYPHFGDESQGYSAIEAALWNKQLHFINKVGYYYGYDKLEPTPADGGASFVPKTYPESWWWANYKEKVMAMTMEMTYGRAGYAPEWITPNHLRTLGEALTFAIRDYYQTPVSAIRHSYGETWEERIRQMEYPEMYPPANEDLK